MADFLLRGMSDVNKNYLKVIAKRNKRSLNNEILIILEAHLEDIKKYVEKK